jgi:ABC-2 type transport system permease protein
MKYWRVWTRLAVMSFWTQAVSPLSSFGYLLGKLVRVAFFLLFLSAIFKHTSALAGYTMEEAALFFLTFNIVDILAQLLFRGIYGVRGMIRDGEFDYFLIQPLNVLFRVAFSTVDFLDVIAILPVFAVTFWVLRRIPGAMTWPHLFLYITMTLNGLLIAFAIHVAVASLAVITQELDNTIWLYRDLMTLGRFPSDIYAAPMRGLLTFVMPIAIMISFPAKAFLGRLSPLWIAHAFLMAAVSVTFALAFWRFANKKYTSVSF